METEEDKCKCEGCDCDSKEDLTPKPYWFWMKNSKGEASASLTFMSIAFTVTTLLYVASAFESIGSISLRQFDVAAASVYFIPLLTLYFGRRFTDVVESKKK